MKRIIYKWLFHKILGWRINGSFDPDVMKSVLMVLPHTSWHDFYIGLLTRGIVGLEMHYVAKKELFRFPFGAYFRYMGGSPLDRSGGRSKVDAIVSLFKSRSTFRMAIAPEGTRKKVSELKSGFYYIAYCAHVPIIPVAFDYGTRTVRIGDAFEPTGNYESDVKVLLRHFVNVTGKNPKLGFDALAYLNR